MSRAGAAVCMALTVAVIVAAPALAHDELVETEPADGAVLESAPGSVDLTFSAEVLDISPTVVITGPAGPVDTVTTVAGTSVTAALQTPLPPGSYAVAWRVVSSDGHPIQGGFGFTVAPSTSTPLDPSDQPPPSAPSPTPTTTPDPSPSPTAAAPTPPPTATEPSLGRPVLLALAGVGGLAGLGAVAWWLTRRLRRPR
ncbi:MAG TPA: copper resistance protein CopC [Actinotalea sp.]|nr:copper resistance protein CopC [Actinotalea sp.]